MSGKRCDGCLHYKRYGGYCLKAWSWAPLSPAHTMPWSSCENWEARPAGRYPLVQLVDGGCVPANVQAVHQSDEGKT